MTQRTRDTQVAIVGAGPVGLTMVMDLAMRGIEVVIVENYDGETAPSYEMGRAEPRMVPAAPDPASWPA